MNAISMGARRELTSEGSVDKWPYTPAEVLESMANAYIRLMQSVKFRRGITLHNKVVKKRDQDSAHSK
jgi:hypothetical protein